MLKLRHGLQRLLERLPEADRNAPELADIRRLSHTPATNIVNLIYESKHLERYSKDYEFGTEAMREHWESGLSDIRRTLTKPGILARPTEDSCFVTHDIHRNGTKHS
ncbi:Patatin phospholipase [compost metagenome]